jgi:acyl-coenzyme A thioesterase PaaI-like protein
MNHDALPLFDAAAVEPSVADTWRGELVEDYTVFGYPNGGYLQCVFANAALAAAAAAGGDYLHATAVTTNFMSAPTLGSVTLHTDVRRLGRGAGFVHVALEQGGKLHAEALVTLGTLSEHRAPKYQDAQVFDMPDPEDCVEPPQHEGMTIHGALEIRVAPDAVAWWEGERSTRAEHRTWVRLRNANAGWDASNVLFATDALWPATLPIGSAGWVPTLQLTSYVRRIPLGEWLRARQWCVVVADGLVDERCELYDERGELVASSSQLALVRFSQES